MRTVAWSSDTHLNFKQGNVDFFNSVKASKASALLLTGDIAEAKDVASFLMDMESKFGIPIYFVLGNHDFYGGSFKQVRAEMEALTLSHDNLFWMPACSTVELADGVGLCGVDGWYDGRYGFAETPKLIMSDWMLIEELKAHRFDHLKLLDAMREVADNEADLARTQLRSAAENYETVYFLTHVPPWIGAAWHVHQHSDYAWQPWFTSKAMGDALEEVAEEYPNTNFEILVGHTHSGGELLVRKNLRCRTAGAKYGEPAITDMICFY